MSYDRRLDDHSPFPPEPKGWAERSREIHDLCAKLSGHYADLDCTWPEYPPKGDYFTISFRVDDAAQLRNAILDMAETLKGKPKTIKHESEVTLCKLFNTPEVREALQRWIDHKKRKRSPYHCPKSLQGAVQRHDSPAEFVKAVEYSIEQGYSGLFSPKHTASCPTPPHLAKAIQADFGKVKRIPLREPTE